MNDATPPKLTCKEVSRLFSEGLDAELPPTQRTRLKLHLAVCEACREVEQQFSLLRRFLHRTRPPDDGAP